MGKQKIRGIRARGIFGLRNCAYAIWEVYWPEQMYLFVLAVTSDNLDTFSLVSAHWYCKIAPVPVLYRSSDGVLQICIDSAGYQLIRPFGRHSNDIGKDTGAVGNAHHRLSVFQNISE